MRRSTGTHLRALPLPALLAPALAALALGCGPRPKNDEATPILLRWVGGSDAGLFAAGDYSVLGDRGPEPSGEAGLLEIDPATGHPLGEWSLGPAHMVLGLTGSSLVTADLLARPVRLALLPLRRDRPDPIATFTWSDGCDPTVSHTLLEGRWLVLGCTAAARSLVIEVREDAFSPVGLLEDACPLSAVESGQLLCLSNDGVLRRYALSDLSAAGSSAGLPRMDATRMVRSNLAHPAAGRIGLVPPPGANPGAETFEIWEIPTSGDATKVAGITLPTGSLGWCQDAWWTGSAAIVTCKEGAARVAGDPLALAAQAKWPTFGVVLAPLGDGRVAAASGAITILDEALEVAGGYRRLWQENPLNGSYTVDEASY